MVKENVIQVEDRESAVIFHIQGDVTRISEPPLKAAYDRLDHKKVKGLLLQFQEKAYFNSEGLKGIIIVLSEARKHQQKAAVTGLSKHFKKIFQMVGIGKLAGVYDTQEEALKSLKDRSKTEG